MSVLPLGHVLVYGQAVSLPTALPHSVAMRFPTDSVTVHAQPALACKRCFRKRHGHSLKAVGFAESENGAVQGAWQTCLARRLMHTCCPPSCRSKTSCTPTGQPHPHPPWAPLASLPRMYHVSCCRLIELRPVWYQLHSAKQSPLIFFVIARFVYQAYSLCICCWMRYEACRKTCRACFYRTCID